MALMVTSGSVGFGSVISVSVMSSGHVRQMSRVIGYVLAMKFVLPDGLGREGGQPI